MSKMIRLIVLLWIILLVLPAPAGHNPMEGGRKSRSFPPPKQAWQPATLILSCPTDNQILVSLTAKEPMEGFIEYGRSNHTATTCSSTNRLSPGSTARLILTGLSRDSSYRYRLKYRTPGACEFQTGPTYSFHTQRDLRQPFFFEVQGDSHPERTPKQNDPILYEQTLLAAARDRPDFYICLGDDFSVDTLTTLTPSSVASVYLKQLPYLGLVAHSSPLFLVNGNHEQAARCNMDGTASNVAIWAQTTRNHLFPQPEPDRFYSGNLEPVKHIGLLRNYYAWHWGDALFVVIDPYWHSKAPVDNVLGDNNKKKRDLWDITLGETQYHWFQKVLADSQAKFKFVFAHHVNGTGRGGIERAGSFEWGGKGASGQDEFATRRPSWPLPIHQLMVKNGVTIFFQGHDHLFCKQELDGVVYQTCPEPADPTSTLYNREAYQSGILFPNSGRIRVSVSPQSILVEYLRSYLPKDSTDTHPDGEVAFAYTIHAPLRQQPLTKQ